MWIRNVLGLTLYMKICDTSVFKDVPIYNITLYVPDGSVGAYRAANVWKDFDSIKPISELVGINGTSLTEALTAWSSNGFLHISGLQYGERFGVYTVSGMEVYTGVACGAKHVLQVQNGVYIIRSEKKSLKAVVNY